MPAISSKLERARVFSILLLLGPGGAAVGALSSAPLGCHREENHLPAVDDGRANLNAGSPEVPDPLRADADPAKRANADDGKPGASATEAGPGATASATASLETPAPAEHPPDPSNRTRPPPTSEDLQERAAHLLDAVAKNEAPLADDFFFPKAPFIPLKDVADPARYFDQLLATYHRDIGSLHAERKDWTGATFVSFELGTLPTWVAPGKEYNKIGYFRTFGGKLRYRIGDKAKEMAVSTIISWDGRWYVTHLSPIRH